MRLLAAGKSNPEIAEELVISLNTVYRDVSHIFDTTGVSNQAETAQPVDTPVGLGELCRDHQRYAWATRVT